MHRDRVTVIGLGYVGLSLAVCLASKGFKVTGYDVDKEKVDLINKCKAPIHEPRLKQLLKSSLRRGFRAYTNLRPSAFNFITVGTPRNKDGSTDLTYVSSAARELGESLKKEKGYSVVVVKSTVPPGTTLGTVKREVESTSGRKFGSELGLAMNPEFLREGSAISDTLNPDRIIIGELDSRSGNSLLGFYRKFYGSKMPRVMRTSIVNAELIKYASNAFLATKVSFINMIANLCQKIPGADVVAVARGMGMDRRIGEDFLRAGPGWGGSCLPKDTKALKGIFEKVGVECPVLDGAIRVNELQPAGVVEMAEEEIGDLRGKRVALLGLSFKPDTDDVRDAVSITIIKMLSERGADIVAYDPVAEENAMKAIQEYSIPAERISFASSAREALINAECCILITEWEEFRRLNKDDFSAMKRRVVIDTRRFFDKACIEGLKVVPLGLGRTGEE